MAVEGYKFEWNNLKIGYTPICSSYYDDVEKAVHFYNEKRDIIYKSVFVNDESDAHKLMRAWKDHAPSNYICKMLV